MTQPPVDPPPPGGQQPPPPGDQTPPPTYEQQWPAPPPAPAPPPRYDSTPQTNYPAQWNQQNLAPVYVQTPRGGTNGFAIAALVFGIIPVCFLGIIFAIVALVQTSKSGQKGKGLAIAGLVLSVLWIAGGVTVAVVNSLDHAGRDSTGAITKSGKLSVDNLKVGDCFNGLDDVKLGDTLQSLDGVPCADLHQGEVYAQTPISGSSYPGRDKLQRSGQTPCAAKLKEVAPQHFTDRDIGFIWIYPEKGSWLMGDHHYTCIAIGVGRRTGSITD